jgi:pimeloyl-ACP methyl ester carboxylesterase
VTQTSHTVDLGQRVHYVDFGGAADGPRVVFVHGLGGSHNNWTELARELRPYARMVAVDLSGHGLTEPIRLRATVHHNAILLRRFLDEVVAQPAVVVGNSMGGMVSILTAAASGRGIDGVILLDPVLPRAPDAPFDRQVARQFALMSIPGLSERILERRLARIPARQRVIGTLNLCFHDPARIPVEVVEAGVALEERRSQFPLVSRAYISATRSLLAVAARANGYRAKMAAITAPVLLIQGDSDRLVPVQNARAIAARFPHWQYVELAGVGHTPQLEAPAEVAAVITQWLAGRGSVESNAGRGNPNA